MTRLFWRCCNSGWRRRSCAASWESWQQSSWVSWQLGSWVFPVMQSRLSGGWRGPVRSGIRAAGGCQHTPGCLRFGPTRAQSAPERPDIAHRSHTGGKQRQTGLGITKNTVGTGVELLQGCFLDNCAKTLRFDGMWFKKTSCLTSLVRFLYLLYSFLTSDCGQQLKTAARWI